MQNYGDPHLMRKSIENDRHESENSVKIRIL
jgi:hypothetical protein